MSDHPYKYSIWFLKPSVEKLEHQNNLQFANSFPSIYRWVDDGFIDNKTFDNFWINDSIIDAKITKILKFRYSQYI